MTITLTLNDEQISGITSARALFEKPDLTNEEWLAEILNEKINGWAAENYQRSVEALGSAARSLPYDQRQTLIANVQSMLT